MLGYLDSIAGLAMRILPDRKRLFADGWGMEESKLTAFYDTAVDPSTLESGAPLEIAWRTWQPLAPGVSVRHGLYRVPVEPELVPSGEAAGTLGQGRLWDVRPDAYRDLERLPKRCLLMGAWADEGLAKRRPIALGLARRGISTVIHETPFHGSRRIYREGSPVRSVHEHALLTRLTATEGVQLFRDLYDEADAWAVAGFSMGASHAGAILALADRPASGALFSVAYSPVIPFVRGELRHYVAWSALGGRDRAESRLADLLGRISLLPLPKPRTPERVLLVGARGDTFIPPWSVSALAEHWPEAGLRWRRGGHGSLFLFERSYMARTIAGLFEG